MTLEQAHELAKRWAGGRQERLQCLHDQLHVDAARDVRRRSFEQRLVAWWTR